MSAILFVCQHGAAKSVVAAELFQRMAGEAGLQVRGVARGTEPQSEVAPAAVAGLLAEGIDVRSYRPEMVSRDDVDDAWRVISFGPELADELQHVAVEKWADVPAVGEGYDMARDTIIGHLRRLVAELARDPAIPRG